MCSHVIAAAMQTPFALYSTRRSAAYLCPHCLGDTIERRLEMPGQQPIDAASAVSFQNCEHDGTGRACWTCLEAASAELVTRWARAFHTDKQRASKLRRVVSHWRRHYDPAGIRSLHTTPQKAGLVQPRKTAVEIADDRRVRMDATRIAKRREKIRVQRRMPQTWTLQTKQTERIVVVPPSQ